MSDRRPCLAMLLAVVATVSHAQPLSDPTEPTSMRAPVGSARTGTAWTLESTLVAADRRLAVINSETVEVGDTVDGARVTEINPYGVRLRTAHGMLELKLTGVDPKSGASGGNTR